MVEYPFEINYKQIIHCDDLLECTRDLARTLNHSPYITFGDYMNELPSSILEQLLIISDDEDNQHFDELLLMSEMLARAEGLDPADSLEQSMTRLNILISILAVESLYRKGMIKAFRQNYSFGEDMMNNIVAKRLDEDDS